MGNQQGRLLETTQKFEKGEHLSLRDTKLGKKEIQEGIQFIKEKLPTLSSLELIGCRVKACPPEIGEINHLLSLKVPHNSLSTLPPSLPLSLLELDLSNNKFDEMPIKNPDGLQSLRFLNLSHNSLSSLPSSLHFRNLEILDLSSNGISSLPESLFQLTSLTHLDLSRNKIKEIPIHVSSLSQLVTLTLSENNLGSFPISIASLSNLRHLSLGSNGLKELAPEISALISLEQLELQHNHLTGLPIEFFRLGSLKILKLYDNEIGVLSEEFGKLEELTEIFFQENQLSRLPKKIGKLKKLRKLFLEFNQLISIPDSLAHLSKLVVLMLHNNKFDRIPPVLYEMKSLLRFSLDHNPMEFESSDTRSKLKDSTKALAVISTQPRTPIASECGSVRIHAKDRESLKLNSSTLPGRLRGRRSSVADTREINLPSPSSKAKHLGVELTASMNSSSSESIPTSKKLARMSTFALSSSEPPTGAAPSYSKFKDAFASFVDQQDFSQPRKKHLEKLSAQEKWSLLSTYKGSSVDLLRLDKKPVKGEKQENPSDFIKTFAARIPTVMELTRLNEAIHKSSDFAKSNFVDAGGMVALTSLLIGTKKSVIKVSNQEAVAVETLQIILYLCNLSVKWLITTTDAISAIVGCLDYGDPEIKSIVFNILEMVCYIHYVGPSLILEALTARVTKIAAPEATSSPSPSPKTNQKAPKKRKSRRLLKNADLIDWGQDFEKGGKSKSSGSLLPVPKKVTVNTKERFVPLVSPLSSVSMSPVNKRNCLYIINSILDSTSDLEERFLLRMEVTALGISNLLPDLPDECSDQRDQYEIDNVQDYQDMFDKFPKDHVNGLIAKAGGNTLGSLGENDGSRLDVLVCFPETFSRICTVPFDADKNWGDHRDAVGEKMAIERRKEYGLYYTNDGENSNPKKLARTNSNFACDPLSSLFVLPLDHSCSPLPFSTSTMSRLQCRPMYLSLSVTPYHSDKIGKSVELQIDPLLDLDQLMATAVGLIEADMNLDSCGLFLGDDENVRPPLIGESDGKWLIPTHKVFDERALYSLSEKKQILYLCDNLFSFSVQFPNESVQHFDNINLSVSGGQVLEYLLKGYGKKLDGYSLLLELPPSSSSKSPSTSSPLASSPSMSSIVPIRWIEGSDIMSSLSLPEHPKFRVAVRPVPVPIIFPGKGEAESTHIDLSSSLFEIVTNLSNRSLLPSAQFVPSLLVGGETSALLLDRPLRPQLTERNLSLRDITMVLKEESGPLRAIDIASGDMCLVECLEENSPCLMYPEEDDMPGMNITFNEDSENREVESATFKKIIQIVTSKRAIEHNFQAVFLFTYKYFSSDEFLLKKLIARFDVPEEVEPKHAAFIRTRVVVFLKHWMTQEWHTTFNEHLKTQIKEFLSTKVEQTKGLEQMAASLAAITKENKQPPSQFGNPPKPKIPKSISGQLTLFDIAPVEIARQLTLETFKLYQKLERTEFFHQNWASESRRHRAPNLMAIISFFNRVSKLIAYSVLHLEKVRERGKMYSLLVEVAQHLKTFNNFHLLAAFVSGLGHCGVSRLKHTIARIKKPDAIKLKELESLMSMESSYRTYRHHLDQSDLPAIPYIGVYLTDLTFIEDGNRDLLGHSRINFAKYRFIYNTLNGLERFQTVCYCLAPVEVVSKYLVATLESTDAVSEDHLYEMSLKREPRGAQRGDIS